MYVVEQLFLISVQIDTQRSFSFIVYSHFVQYLAHYLFLCPVMSFVTMEMHDIHSAINLFCTKLCASLCCVFIRSF